MKYLYGTPYSNDYKQGIATYKSMDEIQKTPEYTYHLVLYIKVENTKNTKL